MNDDKFKKALALLKELRDGIIYDEDFDCTLEEIGIFLMENEEKIFEEKKEYIKWRKGKRYYKHNVTGTIAEAINKLNARNIFSHWNGEKWTYRAELKDIKCVFIAARRY